MILCFDTVEEFAHSFAIHPVLHIPGRGMLKVRLWGEEHKSVWGDSLYTILGKMMSIAGYTLDMKGESGSFTLGPDGLKVCAIESLTLTALRGDLHVDLSRLLFLLLSQEARALPLTAGQSLIFFRTDTQSSVEEVFRAYAPGVSPRLEGGEYTLSPLENKRWKLTAETGLKIVLEDTYTFTSIYEFEQRVLARPLVIPLGKKVVIQRKEERDPSWKSLCEELRKMGTELTNYSSQQPVLKWTIFGDWNGYLFHRQETLLGHRVMRVTHQIDRLVGEVTN